ncbi:MAG TPA: DUF151 domain-containing protein [Candidatus Kapabacteria bacterium]|nr:DUF151 domain-containing protein [Candidatus Kapabacteria bacterium]HOM05614.1 DUF151 domain-containing protein [Candidatus Kapabacteria bacterium]HPP40763.1 DUF151 domain-containing protein [Candidatus Kapabacteria bacterium]
MEKVQLVVLGLSASPAASNAYALILKEVDGERRLPIIIGAFEAQAIALEMEGVTPPRPMTHDLIKNILDQMGATLTEVIISDIVEGTFYAKLVFEDLGIEIDSRPSDAIAIAVRVGCPIYVNAEVLQETGVSPQGEEKEEASDEDYDEFEKIKKSEKMQQVEQPQQPKSRIDILQEQLEKAIKDEDYETAAKIRDELKKMLESS